MCFLRSFALRVGLTPLYLNIYSFRLRFYVLAHIANARSEELQLLTMCVGREFRNATKEFSGIEWRIQAAPGYDADAVGRRISGICWEAPATIVVYVNKKPLVGMGVEFRGSNLCIRQLQGVPSASIPASLQKWPAMFVTGAMNFLLNTEKYHVVRLYAADQRFSYKNPVFDDDRPTEHVYEKRTAELRQRLRRRYDGTAKQLGFTKRSRRFWEWTLELVER